MEYHEVEQVAVEALFLFAGRQLTKVDLVQQ